jgi:hypothetical protein
LYNHIKIYSDNNFKKERTRQFSKKLTFIEFLSNEIKISPHSFLHVGFLINKFFIHLKKKYILSIGLDVVKDTILLNSTKSNIDVLDIDSLNILKIQKLMILWKFNKKLNYIPHDVFKYLNNLNKRHEREQRGGGRVAKRRYDCLLISQMDYIFTCHQLKKILENASFAKIKNIIIITPSVYTFSIKLSNLSHMLSCYLSAISSFINRTKNSTITYRRRLGYFIRLISLNYNIKHTYSYVYPSGLIHMFMLQIKHIK